MVWAILAVVAVVSDSPSVVELLERLTRLEAALAERDARIAVLTQRVFDLPEVLAATVPPTKGSPPANIDGG